MRRSTVLILPPQLVFPAYRYTFCTSHSNFSPKSLCHKKPFKKQLRTKCGDIDPSIYAATPKYK